MTVTSLAKTSSGNHSYVTGEGRLLPRIKCYAPTDETIRLWTAWYDARRLRTIEDVRLRHIVAEAGDLLVPFVGPTS